MIYVWGWAMTTIELEVSQIYGFDSIVKPLGQNMYTTKWTYGEERLWG